MRKNLDIITIPRVIIVDKNSVIKHVGSPNEMKFEESILSISKGGDPVIEFFDDVQDNVWFSKLDDSKKGELVEKVNNKLTEGGATKAKFILTSELAYEGSALKTVKCKPGLTGEISGGEMDILKKLEESFVSEFNLRNTVN